MCVTLCDDNYSRAVKFSSCGQYAVIEMEDVGPKMRRSTYVKYYSDRSSSRKEEIANQLINTELGKIEYTGPNKERDCLVVVLVGELKEKYPRWFVTKETLLAALEKSMQSETPHDLSPEDLRTAKRAWSEKLRGLQLASMAADKSKEQRMVLCQGNYVHDHEGVPIPEPGDRR